MNNLVEPLYLSSVDDKWNSLERDWIDINDNLPINRNATSYSKSVDLSMYNGFDFIKCKLIDPSIKYKWTESLEQATNAIYYDRKSKATRRPKKNNPDYIVQEEVLDSSSSEKVASST